MHERVQSIDLILQNKFTVNMENLMKVYLNEAARKLARKDRMYCELSQEMCFLLEVTSIYF